MDRKYYIPYETAKQIKEKGFPQEHEWFYCDDGKGITPSWDGSHCDCSDGIACPTYHEVLDWLENKDIIIESTKRWVRGNSYAWFSDVHQYNGPIETFIDETREGAINEAIVYALGLM